MKRMTRSARVAVLLALAPLVLGAPDARGAPGSGLSGVVNVNTATLEELQILPGIGEAKAKAIVEARKRHGGFKSVNDLVEVKGIGPAALERLRPHAVVTGKTTAKSP